eukprot:gb/GFBE01053330.1/.p1 GENE.gb/GFBE01053330.1/~~gb/GFBE01053330.1/.p1  ORF type:complete len:443 (+),score=52.70 gb/GFBE01053330.1/:1-1329(+)
MKLECPSSMAGLKDQVTERKPGDGDPPEKTPEMGPTLADLCECGTSFTARAKFCRNCGEKRPDGTVSAPPVLAADRCPSCRTQFSPAARFCRNCGTQRPATRSPGGYPVSPSPGCSADGRGEIVAIFADYDGCFDYISPTATYSWPVMIQHRNKYPAPKTGMSWEFIARMLITSLEVITRDRKKVVLFIGSNRQTVMSDLRNADAHRNGSCRLAYEIIAKERGWELNRAMLADHEDELQNMDSAAHQLLDPQWFAHSSREWKHGRQWPLTDADKECNTLSVSGDRLTKKLLISNGLGQLMKTYPGRKIDVFFFDDRIPLLNHVRTAVATPPNIKLYTVWYDYVTFYKGPIGQEEEGELGGSLPDAFLIAKGRHDDQELQATETQRKEVEAFVNKAMYDFEQPLRAKYGKNWSKVMSTPRDSPRAVDSPSRADPMKPTAARPG